ncbi:hypothetical protein E3A20_26420, partial [Planctomyces bekefii]
PQPGLQGAWGEASKGHSISMQGFPTPNVILVGTPRFDHYYQVRDQQIPSPFAHPYILFVGCSIPFDDTATLEIIDKEITDHPDIYGQTKVVYRPHPWRRDRVAEAPFRSENFKSVVLDPQLAKNYERGKGWIASFQPDVSYYPGLLKNAKLVVGPLTTMLMEALIFRREVVALAYDDGLHYTSPDKALKYYAHFEGLERLAGLAFSHKQAQLDKLMRQSYQRIITGENRISDINYFLYNDTRPYPQRLADFATQTLGAHHEQPSASARAVNQQQLRRAKFTLREALLDALLPANERT